MRTQSYLLTIWLAVALSATCVSAATPEAGNPAPRQPDPLSQAAQEFKTLTREWGMRADSPPSARRRQRRKLPWHGRVYENFRNDFLDAVPHEVKQNGETKSPLRRNQFGFNISGPVLIPHLISNPHNTFFMVTYEGVRENVSRASLHTVPTAAQRRGDFSETVDQAGNLLPIYDPATTSPNAAYDPSLPVSTSNLQYLRSAFPGNIIPADRLDPDVQEVLSLYPLPNTNIGPFNQNNYFVNAPQRDTADGITTKLDHSFGTRHRVMSSTTISRGFLSSPKYFPNVASPTRPDRHISSWRTELGYVFTAGPKTVNSARLTVTSNVVSAGDPAQALFPRYDLGDNYLSMGTAHPDSRNARNTVEFRDAVSVRKGKHSLQVSFHAEHLQVNSFNPAFPSGEFQFSPDITSLPGIINTGDAFAGLLLGLPAYAERTITTSPSYFRDSHQSVSVGDKYEVSKNLTVSMDVGLTRRTPRVEKYDHQSTVDPSVINPSNGRYGALVFAGLYAIPRGLRPPTYSLGMSAGFAWDPLGDAGTVVRASFDRWHGEIPIYDGQWGTQGFNVRQTFVSPNTQLSPALDMAAGIPPLDTTLPDISPSAADNTVADYVDLSGRLPLYQSASLSVEHEVPFSMLVSVGTHYRLGRNILVGDGAANPNAIDPALMSYGNALYDETFRDTLRPFPQYKGFELYGLYAGGRYERKSAYVRVEKHESFGLSFTASYEFSSQFDDFSGPYGNQDFFNWHSNWARASYISPQYLHLSYNYELPFGSGKPLAHFAGWGRPLVSGWFLSGTAYWNDGRPLALLPEFNNTGGVLSTL